MPPSLAPAYSSYGLMAVDGADDGDEADVDGDGDGDDDDDDGRRPDGGGTTNLIEAKQEEPKRGVVATEAKVEEAKKEEAPVEAKKEEVKL